MSDGHYSAGHWNQFLRVGSMALHTWIYRRRKDGRELPHEVDSRGHRAYSLDVIQAGATEDGLELVEIIPGTRSVTELAQKYRALEQRLRQVEEERTALLIDSAKHRLDAQDWRDEPERWRKAAIMLTFAVPIQPSPGVYFLTLGREVVYVGQSTDVASRLAGHRSKKYDRAVMIQLPREQLFEWEAVYIRLLRPPLNRMLVDRQSA